MINAEPRSEEIVWFFITTAINQKVERDLLALIFLSNGKNNKDTSGFLNTYLYHTIISKPRTHFFVS